MSSHSSYPSTTSLASVASSTTACTTTTISPKAAPKKDYDAAFAALQSTYGMTGGVPTPIHTQSITRTKVHKPASDAGSEQRTRGTKNFKAAFAALSCSYGFSGGAPMPVSSEGTKSPARGK